MRYLLLMLAAAALALSGCGSPQTPPPDYGPAPKQRERSVPAAPYVGIDVPSPATGAEIPGDPEEDLERAKDLGANTIRLAIRWDWLEHEAGGMDPERAAEVDGVIERARQLGLGVLAQPIFTPCWASSAPRDPSGACIPTHGLYPPADAATYGAFVKEIVSRWGRGFVGLEVWNEPNHAGYWTGTPQQYVDLVRAASAAVDSSPYADLPVVGGAISGAQVDYLKQLYEAGIADWADVISIHPYDVRFNGPGFGDPSIARAGDPFSFAAGVPAVHELMAQQGDTDPLWITEFGYADCPATPHCVTPELQGEYLRKAVELAATWPYVQMFLVYRLRDWVPQDGGMEGRFGVLNMDGSPKPAASALAPAFEQFKEAR